MVIRICKFHGKKDFGVFGSFKQIVNFDKLEQPLCGFQFSNLKLIVKNCCDLFQKYFNSSTAWISDSQPRFKN